MLYQVAEIFTSINGEGLRAGKLALFIRLSGCPLKCSYCDTDWARDASVGKTMTLKSIVEAVRASNVNYVTLTGGEPLSHAKVNTLIEALLQIPQINLEIETSGAMSILGLEALRYNYSNLHLTLDYKLAHSGMSVEMKAENYKHLKKGDAVKYVISDSNELAQMTSHIMSWYEDTSNVEILLSPVYGKIEASELVEWLKSVSNEAFQVQTRVQLQLHKYIWHPAAKGV